MTTAQINYLNIGLMLASTLCGSIYPYETFVFSYVVLGPAHYLTQISWLHDRRYFATGKYDAIFLSVPVFFLVFVSPIRPENRAAVVVTAVIFGSALGMALFRRPQTKFALAGALFCAAFVISGFEPARIFLALLLPTIVHVFLFTGAFILFGALRSRSTSGVISFVIFLGCALFCFVFPADLLGGYVPSPFSLYASEPFRSMTKQLESLVGLAESEQASNTAMRFVAFAYTYHYLNWFSKTRIIGWHEISRDRLVTIVGLYVLCLGLYAANYILGFTLVLFLSFLHVFLEFPLNFRSFVGIGTELAAIRREGWVLNGLQPDTTN